MGGGHLKANPHQGKKGPCRGDQKREEKAGRKRISKEYRPKGHKVTALPPQPMPPDMAFTIIEYKIIYSLNIGGKYEDEDAECEKLAKINKVPYDEIERFIQTLKQKLEHRKWGKIRRGRNKKHYVSLSIEHEEDIQVYLDCHALPI